jgi:4,5-DOPA dioxygenase extradiol
VHVYPGADVPVVQLSIDETKTPGWHYELARRYDWAMRFETMARERLLAGDFEALVAYETLGPDAMLAAPTPDHYLPLIYVLAQHREGDPIRFPVEGFDGGSISMLAVRLG